MSMRYKIEMFFENFKYMNFFEWILDKVIFWSRRIFFPYNSLKIKTIGRGWYDKDGVMLHAVMQLIVDFVEKEWGGPKKRLKFLKECLIDNDWAKDWVAEEDFAKEFHREVRIADMKSVLYDLKILGLYFKWKEIVKDNKFEDLTTEEEDELLKEAFEIRKGLWS